MNCGYGQGLNRNCWEFRRATELCRDIKRRKILARAAEIQQTMLPNLSPEIEKALSELYENATKTSY